MNTSNQTEAGETINRARANHPHMVHNRIDGRIETDPKAHAQILEWSRKAHAPEDEGASCSATH